MENIIIREGSIAEAVAVSLEVPELVNPHREAIYEQRLSGKAHLILIAELDSKLVGFKVGYERDSSFYSWMGGVLPAYRKKKIAKLLAQKQESWAKSQAYTTITFKTRNHHKGMLIFALKNGFNIIGFKESNSIETNRILLRKNL